MEVQRLALDPVAALEPAQPVARARGRARTVRCGRRSSVAQRATRSTSSTSSDAAGALVGERRVDVAVGDHDVAAVERRQDHGVDVLGLVGGVEQRLGAVARARRSRGSSTIRRSSRADPVSPGSKVSSTAYPSASQPVAQQPRTGWTCRNPRRPRSRRRRRWRRTSGRCSRAEPTGRRRRHGPRRVAGAHGRSRRARTSGPTLVAGTTWYAERRPRLRGRRRAISTSATAGQAVRGDARMPCLDGPDRYAAAGLVGARLGHPSAVRSSWRRLLGGLLGAFLAGAFLAPFLAAFFAGPLARRSASSSAARSSVIASTVVLAERGVVLAVGDVRAEPAGLDHDRRAGDRVVAELLQRRRPRRRGRAAWAGRRSPAPRRG